MACQLPAPGLEEPEPVATLGHIRGRGPLDTSSCETGTQETVGGMEQPEVAEGSGPPAPARQLAGHPSFFPIINKGPAPFGAGPLCISVGEIT